ncbi:MAG: transferrin-binding protein-like solute binding protein [Alphaproteobacteria bacterium]|nr:transferrin-binding protein-like solute binding protein [Alphaproteobacteria bacterium]
MRQLLFPIITLFTLSFMLTACTAAQRTDVEEFQDCPDGQKVLQEQTCPIVDDGSDDNGDNGDNGDNDGMGGDNMGTVFAPGYTATVSQADTPIAIENPASSEHGGHVSLATVSGGSVTLQGLAVMRDDNIVYKRAAAGDPWRDSDTKALKVDALNIDRQIIMAPFTAPAVTIAFNVDGNIVGATLHLDRDYTISEASDLSPNGITGVLAGNPENENMTDDDDVSVSLDRINVFGLTDADETNIASNYMAYISWGLDNEASFTDTSGDATETTRYDIDGAMIVGFETETIPANGMVTFTGKGKGTYGSLTKTANEETGYDTVFDITAEVDFGSHKTVTINSSNTCLSTTTNCAAGNTDDWKDFLNFTTDAITYTDAVMNVADTVISGAVTTTKNDNNLAGTLDARFYGGAAWELGGTFWLIGSNETHALYYLGAFGAQRVGIPSEQTLNADAVTTLEMVNADDTATIDAEIAKNGAYHSLTDLADASGENSFTMKALSVYKDDTTSYIRAPKRDWATYADTAQTINLARLAGSAASLTFNGDGNISGVTAYLKGETYTATIATPTSGVNVSMATITAGADGATTAEINVRRDSGFFSFASNYMAYIDWHVKNVEGDIDNASEDLADDVFDIAGYMIAGIETTDLTGLVGKVDFVGKGSGFYDNITDEVVGVSTVFDVKAEVDFDASTVKIISDNTTGNFENYDYLDITTGALSFIDGGDSVNKISGNVTTGSFGNNLAGTLDARFYGIDARELGGTFALTGTTVATIEGNYSYYGAFGAERDTYDSSITATPIATDATIDGYTLPVTSQENGLTSLHGSNNLKSKTDTALIIPNIVRMTKSTMNETITNDKITGAVVVFDYDSNGYFVTNEGMQLYYADKKYEIEIGSGSASNNGVQNDSAATNNGTTSVDDDNPHTLIFSRADTYFGGGFPKKYMALVHWQANDDDGSGNITYNSYGYGIAGFETAIIPATETNVSFTGKGGGFYSDGAASYATEFDVTATVDFVNSMVSINSSATMKCADNSCTQTINALDFTTGETAIGYTTNAISGNVTAGDLSGTLDARFYGTNAEEIGGTFSMGSDNAGYIGFFGAKKQE